MNRSLSGIFFREKRNGKFESICFEDLTEQEQNKILSKLDTPNLKGLARSLAKSLKEIGDKFDIISE